MDEVPRDSGIDETKGMIRVLLPKDGSISLEEVEKYPGVRVIDPLPGDLLRRITISARDIPEFRARAGSFMMGPRVLAKLEEEDTRSRTLAEESGKKQVVQPEELEGPDGNINPDGLLKGLVKGDEGIQPGEHRIRALQKLAKNNGRLYAAHFMGCLSGDTEIPINRCGKGFTITLRELYKRQTLGSTGWDMAHSTYATSLFDQYLRLNEVLNVVDSGVQETFLVRSYRTNLLLHPYAGVRGAKLSPFRVPTHRLVAEARLNSLSLDEFIQRCRHGSVEGLTFLDPAVYAVHHKDGDTFNNDPVNLEVLPHDAHWRLHGESEGWTNFNQFQLGWDEVEFVGDERTEPTYDICMHVQSQSYVANDFVVHNTGKTALAIMAAQMMRNLKDPSDTTKPHPKQLKKKVLHVVPLNTGENWFQEYVNFLGAPTLLGAQTLSGAQQLPKLPKRSERESDDAYRKKVIDAWRAALEKNPRLWNPWADANDNAVIPMEYFRDNEEALRLTGMFDGLVVDEAHKVARENQISRAIERWNPQMNLFLLLSGTPITNNLNVLPRIVDLITAGEVKLGSEEEFSERYLVASQVMKALNRKSSAKTDLNPQRVGELAAILQPLIDIATTADVKGKSMPAVLLDENEPAHMTGQQGRMYRAAMAALTDAERAALDASGALGLDEKGLLDEKARRKIQVARSIANAPSYKAPDDREDATFEAVVVTRDKHGRSSVSEQTQVFELPSLGMMTSKKKGVGWRGKWPDLDDVEAGRVNRGYYSALHQYIERVLGVGYEFLEGKKIEETPVGKKLLAALRKKGEYITLTGEKWQRGVGMSQGGKLKNPDYGPEGVTRARRRGVCSTTRRTGTSPAASMTKRRPGRTPEVRRARGKRTRRSPISMPCLGRTWRSSRRSTRSSCLVKSWTMRNTAYCSKTRCGRKFSEGRAASRDRSPAAKA
jgi:hypothetical protein